MGKQQSQTTGGGDYSSSEASTADKITLEIFETCSYMITVFNHFDNRTAVNQLVKLIEACCLRLENHEKKLNLIHKFWMPLTEVCTETRDIYVVKSCVQAVLVLSRAAHDFLQKRTGPFLDAVIKT